MTPRRLPSLFFQLLPPLLLLWPASTRHGPSLYFISGLFGVVGLFSLVRVGYLVSRPDRPYQRLYRPTLALFLSVLALVHTRNSMEPARAFARQTAAAIQAQCQARGECPRSIPGWGSRQDLYSSQTTHGRWVQWPILFHSDGRRFTVRFYVLLDIGEQWSGGVEDGRD